MEGAGRSAPRICVKRFLTVGQKIGLLPIVRQRTLCAVRQFSQQSTHMSNEVNLVARIGQGLLAVAATGVSVLVLKLAMLA